jgi:hypothetical protein
MVNRTRTREGGGGGAVGNNAELCRPPGTSLHLSWQDLARWMTFKSDKKSGPGPIRTVLSPKTLLYVIQSLHLQSWFLFWRKDAETSCVLQSLGNSPLLPNSLYILQISRWLPHNTTSDGGRTEHIWDLWNGAKEEAVTGILEKLIVVLLVSKVLVIHGNRGYIT